jgi:hypothetical protein
MKRNENGSFATGNKGGGRVKGSENKATGELRDFISHLVNENKDKLQNDLDMLEPKERVDAFIKLLEFTTPKLQRTQLEGDITHKNHVVVTIENEQPKIEDNGKSN